VSPRAQFYFLANYVYTYSLHARTMISFHWPTLTVHLSFCHGSSNLLAPMVSFSPSVGKQRVISSLRHCSQSVQSEETPSLDCSVGKWLAGHATIFGIGNKSSYDINYEPVHLLFYSRNINLLTLYPWFSLSISCLSLSVSSRFSPYCASRIDTLARDSSSWPSNVDILSFCLDLSSYTKATVFRNFSNLLEACA